VEAARNTMIRRYVIDASVAIKWLVPEEGTEHANRLRAHRLVAPDLLVVECAKALWKHARREEITEQEAIVAARLLAHSELELIPMLTLLEPATRLAIQPDHAAYDCTYLALAEREGCKLVTADKRLIRKADTNKSDFQYSRSSN
jgi:predicted nucleic acid-binding protein